MAYLTPGDFANSRRYQGGRRPVRGGPSLNDALGALAGSKKKKRRAALAAMQAAQAAAEAHRVALARIKSVQATMESNVTKIQRAASAARDQAFSIQDMAGQVDHPSAFSLAQEAQDLASDINTRSQEASRLYDDFQYEASAAQSKGGNYAVELLVKAENASNQIKTTGGRVSRDASAMAASVGRLNSLQRKTVAQQQAAAQQQAQQQALADQQAQDARDRQFAEEERLRMLEENRLAREEQARQAETEFQRMQLEEQRRIRDLEYEREAQERARIAQIEQQRIDAEMRREQQAIAADERRARLQEAAALRAEEAALRREEREAQLQQLMLIQELASQGLPSHLIPAGLPSPGARAQQAPAGQQQYTMPGFAPPPSSQPTIPQGAWSPYGQVVMGPGGPAPTGFAPAVPGVALSPSGLPPGYAAQPAPAAYQQSPGFPGAASLAPQGMPMQAPYPQQPAPEAPPGFAWGGFDPGTEMFGMGDLGALHQTFNPNLQGGLIEEGWSMSGPDGDGNYTLTRPGGQLFNRYTEDQVYAGTIRDETGNIVWTSPPSRPQSTTGADVASVLRAAIEATGSVLTAQEQRKAQKYASKARAQAGAISASIPGAGYAAGSPVQQQSNALAIAAGVALAAGAFWGVSKVLGGKKGKK